MEVVQKGRATVKGNNVMAIGTVRNVKDDSVLLTMDRYEEVLKINRVVLREKVG